MTIKEAPMHKLRKVSLNFLQKHWRYKRNKPIINRVVLTHLGKTKSGIVHGTRASNAQLPWKLRQKTTDWDIIVEKPQISAIKMEKKLDKKFGGDFFRVKKGKTKELKVHKVVSNIDDEGYVDFAIADRDVPFITKSGIVYATLRDQYERAKQNLKKPSAKYRRKKDLSLIKRVNKYKKLIGGKL